MDASGKSTLRWGHRRWCRLGFSMAVICRMLAAANQGNYLKGTNSEFGRLACSYEVGTLVRA
jgi:hypothetical protein